MKKFCVISPAVGSAGRTWAEIEAEATEHGKKLVQQSYAKNGKPLTLLVVEVKKVIEIGMPLVVERELAATDTEPEPEVEDEAFEEEESPRRTKRSFR